MFSSIYSLLSLARLLQLAQKARWLLCIWRHFVTLYFDAKWFLTNRPTSVKTFRLWLLHSCLFRWRHVNNHKTALFSKVINSSNWLQSGFGAAYAVVNVWYVFKMERPLTSGIVLIWFDQQFHLSKMPNPSCNHTPSNRILKNCCE